jgi:hypothetical protein
MTTLWTLPKETFGHRDVPTTFSTSIRTQREEAEGSRRQTGARRVARRTEKGTYQISRAQGSPDPVSFCVLSLKFLQKRALYLGLAAPQTSSI